MSGTLAKWSLFLPHPPAMCPLGPPPHGGCFPNHQGRGAFLGELSRNLSPFASYACILVSFWCNFSCLCVRNAVLDKPTMFIVLALLHWRHRQILTVTRVCRIQRSHPQCSERRSARQFQLSRMVALELCQETLTDWPMVKAAASRSVLFCRRATTSMPAPMRAV